jgi:hypothetical protein
VPKTSAVAYGLDVLALLRLLAIVMRVAVTSTIDGVVFHVLL